MEKFPSSQENNLDKQIESEKNLLGENSAEISNLVIEKSGSYSEKAKLLMARVGKIASGGVAVAGGAAALAMGGVIGHEFFTAHSNEINQITGELRNINFQDAKEMIATLDLSILAGAIGALGVSKFNDVIEKIKSKIQQLKPVRA